MTSTKAAESTHDQAAVPARLDVGRVPSGLSASTARELVYMVPLECLLCGRRITEVRLETEYAPIPLQALRLRCEVCGGQSVRGTDARMLYVGPPIDMRDETKRGRPSKALVEQRKQQLARLE